MSIQDIQSGKALHPLRGGMNLLDYRAKPFTPSMGAIDLREHLDILHDLLEEEIRCRLGGGVDA